MAAGSRTASSQPGVIDGIRYDLVRMHETWMELFFPRQRSEGSSVLGKWQPKTAREKLTYNSWRLIGAPVIGLLYPLVLFGYLLRFQSRRIDYTAAKLGKIGVFALFLLLWGGLTAVARVRFTPAGFFAVGAASGVAVFSALLALLFRSLGGRLTTVVFAYPFAMTAIFLPPVVAALYSPTLAAAIFPRSQTIAIWILDNPLSFLDLGEYLRRTYDLRGVAYAGMWFGLAVPVGWVLGVLVTLADLVRPKPTSTDEDDDE
ncbi:hypothetical protein ACFR9U_09085 [Halorientalis brevis]|uniref:ABC transporter permease n=1 Tax=Halorientalis brevis TaxID=1126241 RepID=A0ABD6CB24_9EURY|nr:hypothetical protein [Halorientalis brevis]